MLLTTIYGATIFEWIIFIWAVGSVPFYLLVLAVLIRHRNVDPFRAPFFKLCISEGVADILMTFVGDVLLLPRLWGWVDWGPLFYHPTMAWFFRRFYYVFSWIFAAPQISGVIIITVNRYQSIIYPETPAWNKRKVLCSIVLQWLTGPIAAVGFAVQDAYTVEAVNNSEGQTIYHSRPPKLFHSTFLLCIVVYIYSIIAAASYMYVKMFAKMRKHNSQKKENNPQMNVKKTEWRLALVGFSLFVVLLFYGLFFGVYALAAKGTNATLKHITNILLYNTPSFLSMINPYLLVIFSKKTKEKTLAMIGCKSNTVAPRT